MNAIKWIFAATFCICLTAVAETQAGDSVPLKLLPAPREIHLSTSAARLVIKPSTTILISNPEDRLAAETLQTEIEERTRIKLAIQSVTAAPKTPGHISLGRLTDRGLRGYLNSQGVQTDDLGPVDLASQGYVIRSSEQGVIVAGSSAQGLFYGVQTLRQLLHAEGPRAVVSAQREPSQEELFIPALTIRDWPSMQWRGVSDDISRGPILTLDYLKYQIRTLAEYKINLLGLNMENVFDFQSQPLVVPGDAGTNPPAENAEESARENLRSKPAENPALTPAEIRDLVSYAARYFITILPEQQAFGHLHQFLKYEIYSDIAETPHGHVLTPTNPKTYDFIRQVYGEVVPQFPGPFFHIGSDETFELGLGQTKDLAAKEGLGRVYLEHLQKVFEIMQPYHKQLMFWGDIAVKYPELLSILPKEMIAVPWDYDPKPSYENIITPYSNAGLRVVVAPGAGNWRAIWPDFDSAFVNIRNFVRDGQKHQAMGVLNTMWHDDGETLTDMTWPALVFGASAGWQPGESSIVDFKKSYDWAFYRNDTDSTFAGVLDNLDRANTLLAALKLDNASNDLFWSDPFSAAGAATAATALPATHDLRLGAEHALETLAHDSAKARVHRETLEDLSFAAWRLDTLGLKLQFTSEIARFYADAYQNQTDGIRAQHDLDEIVDINGRLQSLRDAITALRQPYAEAWMRENHPYWLENVLVRYDALSAEIQNKIVAVLAAQRQFWTTKTLPPPETLGLLAK